MKKLLILLLVIFCILTGCSKEDKKDNGGAFFLPPNLDPAEEPKTYNATLKDGDYLTASISFTVDFTDFTKSNTEYNKSIALLSSVLCNDLAGAWSSKLEGYSTLTKKSIYENIGFTDVEIKVLKNSSYDVDKNDVSRFALARHKFSANNIKYDLVVVNVCMTGSNIEWASNFDFGADSVGYYNANGESHPDWLNKNHHKGFDVVANRISVFVDEYLEKIKEEDRNTIILFTGYSRGAGVANILAANYNKKNSQAKIFGYTFSSPRVVCTTEDTVTGYENIFNIYSEEDIIPKVPFASWNFKRYGVDMPKSLIDDTNYKELLGINYSYVDLAKVANLSLFDSTRDEVYDKELLFFEYKSEYQTGLEDATISYNKLVAAKEKLGNTSIRITEVELYDSENGYYSYEVYGTMGDFVTFINYIIKNEDTFGISLLTKYLDYFTLYYRYLPLLTDVISVLGYSFDTSKVSIPHLLLTDVAIVLTTE